MTVEFVGIGEFAVGVVVEIDEHQRVRFHRIEMLRTDFVRYLPQQDGFAATPHPGNDFNQLRVVERTNPFEILRSQNHSGFLSIELNLLNSIIPI